MSDVSRDAAAFAPCIERHRSLAWAAGGPEATARPRSRAEDFRVDEVLRYEIGGEGSHAWLHIRKRNANTEWVARRVAQVPPTAVGYAGLKDRLGVATRWHWRWRARSWPAARPGAMLWRGWGWTSSAGRCGCCRGTSAGAGRAPASWSSASSCPAVPTPLACCGS